MKTDAEFQSAIKAANDRIEFYRSRLLEELLPECDGDAFLAQRFVAALVDGDGAARLLRAVIWVGYDGSDYVVVKWGGTPELRDIRLIEAAARALSIAAGCHVLNHSPPAEDLGDDISLYEDDATLLRELALARDRCLHRAAVREVPEFLAIDDATKVAEVNL